MSVGVNKPWPTRVRPEPAPSLVGFYPLKPRPMLECGKCGAPYARTDTACSYCKAPLCTCSYCKAPL